MGIKSEPIAIGALERYVGDNTSAKKTAWSATVSDDNYPSEKLVKDSLDLKENAANKVDAWSAEPNDVHYPTEKLVKDALKVRW